MEHGGTGNKKGGIKIFEPGQISQEMICRLEEFKFPLKEFRSTLQREKELEIDRSYNHRSFFIVFFSDDEQTILGTTKIIAKRSEEEKLPIEYGRVLSINRSSMEIPIKLEIGKLFSILGSYNVMPVCEIAGLRVAQTNKENSISMRRRYYALQAILQISYEKIHTCGFRSFFLTCVGTQNMERLYQDKFHFNEVARITYGSNGIWKALWQSPNKNRHYSI